MAIKISCQCGAKIRAKDEYAGRKAVCPSCKRELMIEAAVDPLRSNEAILSNEPPPSPALLETKRRWWRDPIIVTGATLPALILLGFIGYLAMPALRKMAANKPALTKSAESQDQPSLRRVVPNAPALSHQNPKIPVEISYPILKEENEPPIKRTVYVRLNMKVAAKILREIALDLKSQETEQYEFTYVFYTLPGTLTNAPWAITHFAPTLNVEIVGLTIELEAFLMRQPITIPTNAKLLGSWIADEVPWRITIFVKDGEYWLQQLFGPSKMHQEGSTNVSHLSVRSREGAMDFQQDGGTDHYLLDRSGNLEVRADDDGGRVLTPKRLKQTGG